MANKNNLDRIKEIMTDIGYTYYEYDGFLPQGMIQGARFDSEHDGVLEICRYSNDGGDYIIDSYYRYSDDDCRPKPLTSTQLKAIIKVIDIMRKEYISVENKYSQNISRCGLSA